MTTDDFTVLVNEKVADCFECPYELDEGETQGAMLGGSTDYDEEYAGNIDMYYSDYSDM